MQSRIMYIEHKTDQNNKGDAWIGRVEFSKSGRTVYFNGQAFKKGQGIESNYYDLETGDEYWISGPKKNGQDRLWSTSGKVKVDRSIANEYLSRVDFEVLDKNNFELVDIQPTDKQKFVKLENERL